jgi:hypothetical protein
LAPLALLFCRSTSRASVAHYLTGLLTGMPRKNCDTIAAAVAGISTERLQHLLIDATWASQALISNACGPWSRSARAIGAAFARHGGDEPLQTPCPQEGDMAAGEIPYTCGPHPPMVGKIIVVP